MHCKNNRLYSLQTKSFPGGVPTARAGAGKLCSCVPRPPDPPGTAACARHRPAAPGRDGTCRAGGEAEVRAEAPRSLSCSIALSQGLIWIYKVKMSSFIYILAPSINYLSFF